MRLPYLISPIFLFANCKSSEVDKVNLEELIPSSELAASHRTENKAQEDSLEQALKDVITETSKFDVMNSEDLIRSIVKSKNPKTFGGYEYFYSSQLNYKIIQELRRRGEKTRANLVKYQNSKLSVYEAISGPGHTVGTLCRSLERELDKIKQVQ